MNEEERELTEEERTEAERVRQEREKAVEEATTDDSVNEAVVGDDDEPRYDGGAIPRNHSSEPTE
jgi:hypothetical protein